MFTGIIEALGKVISFKDHKDNRDFLFEAPFISELKIDQSVAHNGVCLTVTAIEENSYSVTAIKETLEKTNLGDLIPGDLVNLERCMLAQSRFDGHIVQGHVDQTATCTSVTETNGSWIYEFEYDPKWGNITVEKGSVCINGVSLTVVNSGINTFSVAIIPYTYHHTNFKHLKSGDIVNIEFDIIGKYLKKLHGLMNT